MSERTRSMVRKAALGVGACAILATLGAAAGFAQTKPPPDRQDAAVAYAQCIREKGFPEFPDPSPDGRLQMRVTAESAPRLEKAQQACRQLAPTGMADNKVSPENIEALMQLAQCVRKNGVAAFPDPDSEGRLNFGGTGIDPQNARVQAAMKTCTNNGALAGGGRMIITR